MLHLVGNISKGIWPINVYHLYEEGSSSRICFFYHGATAPVGSEPPHYRGFTITLRHNTLVRTLGIYEDYEIKLVGPETRLIVPSNHVSGRRYFIFNEHKILSPFRSLIMQFQAEICSLLFIVHGKKTSIYISF